MNVKRVWPILVLSSLGLCCKKKFNTDAGYPLRAAYFAELRPVKLKNCTLKRFGEKNDGGYLMCENLLSNSRAAYSYGIEGRDVWGCDISKKLNLTIHEYDCFNLTKPVCPGGNLAFHAECIADTVKVEEKRPYSTFEKQVEKNGDKGKFLLVKMDVEGAEWDSLLKMNDAQLDKIDQLAIELHGAEDPRFPRVIQRLKKYFYVAHVHSNNHACKEESYPFTSNANEILFVSKRLAEPDTEAPVPALPHPEDAPNNGPFKDCPVPRLWN